jgi:hypothetical protein
LDIEHLKIFCREKLKAGISQKDLAVILTENAKEKPNAWQVGTDPNWSTQKLLYYLKKWNIGPGGGERPVKEKEDPEYSEFDIDRPNPTAQTYVFVAVPQSKLSTVLGALQ